MKISTFLFRALTVVFLIFALVMTAHMSAHMTEDEDSSRQILTYIFLLLDLICLAIIFQDSNWSTKGIHLVCLLWVIIMPIVMFLNHAQMANYVRVILWPLLFEATYLCCRNCVSRGLRFKKMMVVVAAVATFYFLKSRLGIEYQTNTIFLVYLTLPWLLFESKKRDQLIVLGVFTLFAMLSLKRSMLLMTALTWSFYFLFGMKSKRNRIYTIIFSIVLLAGIYILFDKVNNSTNGLLTERINREETDEGRNRLAIWTLTSSMIQNSSAGKLIIGHGHYAVRRDSLLGISAHNDFLEVIYDYGLVIFILYLGLWRLVIRRAASLFRIGSSLFLPYAASLSIFLFGSLVSHLVLYTSYFNYLVIFWAMMEAIVEYEINQKNREELLPK